MLIREHHYVSQNRQNVFFNIIQTSSLDWYDFETVLIYSKALSKKKTQWKVNALFQYMSSFWKSYCFNFNIITEKILKSIEGEVYWRDHVAVEIVRTRYFIQRHCTPHCYLFTITGYFSCLTKHFHMLDLDIVFVVFSVHVINIPSEWMPQISVDAFSWLFCKPALQTLFKLYNHSLQVAVKLTVCRGTFEFCFATNHELSCLEKFNPSLLFLKTSLASGQNI